MKVKGITMIQPNIPLIDDLEATVALMAEHYHQDDMKPVLAQHVRLQQRIHAEDYHPEKPCYLAYYQGLLREYGINALLEDG